MSEPRTTTGLWYAIFAYTFWGVVPIYLQLTRGIDGFELIGWRVIASVVVAFALVAATRGWGRLAAVLRSRRDTGSLVLAGFAVLVNWTAFFLGVLSDRVLETSLGYFLNPLVSVVLAVLFLGERLRPVQWVAVGLARLLDLLWGRRERQGRDPLQHPVDAAGRALHELGRLRAHGVHDQPADAAQHRDDRDERDRGGEPARHAAATHPAHHRREGRCQDERDGHRDRHERQLRHREDDARDGDHQDDALQRAGREAAEAVAPHRRRRDRHRHGHADIAAGSLVAEQSHGSLSQWRQR